MIRTLMLLALPFSSILCLVRIAVSSLSRLLAVFNLLRKYLEVFRLYIRPAKKKTFYLSEIIKNNIYINHKFKNIFYKHSDIFIRLSLDNK